MNYKLLKKLMKERGIGFSELSKKTKIGKLRLIFITIGIFDFTAKEILLIEKALFLTEDQVMAIFFD